jgi:hypothetical protein
MLPILLIFGLSTMAETEESERFWILRMKPLL